MMKKTFAWCKASVKAFLDNHCSMHAAGLTYFSLLALVPVLCLLLLGAKTFGAGDLIKDRVNAEIDLMIENIEKGQDDGIAAVATADETKREEKKLAAQEIGRQARELRDKLFERIDSFDVGTLGWIGLLLLMWTVISSMGMVEVSFNEIWNVPKPRPIWHRAWLYLLVAIVIPVLSALAASVPILKIAKDIIVATAGATWITKWLSDGLVWILDSTLFRFAVTLLFLSLSYAFQFWVMPNCRVRFKFAWWGGLVTAAMFAGWLKVCAVAQVGIAKSSALYGSFAFVPIMLAWLYMSWQIVLLGACMVKAFEDAK
jgi:membrane protein